jgi:hypothetical protein
MFENKKAQTEVFTYIDHSIYFSNINQKPKNTLRNQQTHFGNPKSGSKVVEIYPKGSKINHLCLKLIL